MLREQFKKGQRYEVETPFRGHVLITWKAPFTGGYVKTIPSGLKFVVSLDPPETATAISADVEDPKWEELLVDSEDRENPKYGGYYLVVDFGTVAASCVRVP